MSDGLQAVYELRTAADLTTPSVTLGLQWIFSSLQTSGQPVGKSRLEGYSFVQ
jgi:hypothetical protein